MKWIVPLLVLLVTGCTTVSSSVCPVPKTYSQERQQRALSELKKLQPPEFVEIPAFMDDYGDERAKLFRCNGMPEGGVN